MYVIIYFIIIFLCFAFLLYIFDFFRKLCKLGIIIASKGLYLYNVAMVSGVLSFGIYYLLNKKIKDEIFVIIAFVIYLISFYCLKLITKSKPKLELLIRIIFGFVIP